MKSLSRLSASWKSVALASVGVVLSLANIALAQEHGVISEGPWMPGATSRRQVQPIHVGFVPKHEQWAASQGWKKADAVAGETEVGRESVHGSVLRTGPGEAWTMDAEESPVWEGELSEEASCSDGSCEADLRSWQLLGGVQGFTGPANRGGQGSFGLYEGLNYGAPLPLGIPTEIGWQAGLRLTQSNLSGSTFTLESRHQLFATLGLFHRVDRGLQWALAADWLHEDWYFEADLMQVRGEASWKVECEREFGIAFAMGSRATTAVPEFHPTTVAFPTEPWQATDWYVGFYRMRFGSCEANTVRAFAGFTGQSDGLLGADSIMQINERWAVQSGFTFLIPAESSGWGANAGHVQESWNVAIGLVWTPGCSTVERSYYTPLLNVADNGAFFVDRQ